MIVGASPPAAFARETASSGTEKPFRWGIIGTGTRGGGVHLPALLSFADFEVLGVCDLREELLARAIDTAGGKVQAYLDYQKLLANPDIDAVVIATPNCWHEEMLLAALQAKKHVVCEKPIAVSYDQCKVMKSAVERSDRTVLFAMQLRYSTRWQAFRNTIEEGRIGRPLYALMAEFRGDWNRDNVWEYTDPKSGRRINWRYSYAASGGTLSEKACHHFDLLAWMMGENPISVKCEGGITFYHDERDTWDHASTILRYPSGAAAIHSLCMFGPERVELQIIGEKGSVRATEGSEALVLEINGKHHQIMPEAEIGHSNAGRGQCQETAVLRMYEHFIECVAHNSRPMTDVNKAIAASKTAWLGELSSQRKDEAHWDDL